MRYPHTDRRGSTVAVSQGGQAVERFHYGEFGQSGPTITGYPYRYTGQRLDARTGLYNYKAREYAPNLGRFLQPDPLGFVDGPNVYAYVGNSPLNSIDPRGTESYIVGRRIFSDEQAAKIGRIANAAAGGRTAGAIAGALAEHAARNTKHAFLVITAEGTSIEDGQIEGIYSWGPTRDGTGLAGMGNTSFRSGTGDATSLDDIAATASIARGQPADGVSYSQIEGVSNREAAQIFGTPSEPRLYSPVPGFLTTNSNSEAFARGQAAAEAGGGNLRAPAGIYPGANQAGNVICPNARGVNIC